MAEITTVSSFGDFPVDISRIILSNLAQVSPRALQRICSSSRNAHYRALCLEAAEKQLGEKWPKQMTTPLPATRKKPNVIRRLWDIENSFPIWKCENCNMRFCGTRCCGSRDPTEAKTYVGDGYYGYHRNPDFVGPIPTPSGCGKYLFLDTQTKLVTCPTHHEQYLRMKCPCQNMGTDKVTWMTVSLDTQHTVDDYKQAHKSMPQFVCDQSPLATCVKCGWSVEGALCAGEPKFHSDLRLLDRNGFYERVACAYVWNCEEGCGRHVSSGGCYHGGSQMCMCQIEAGGEPTRMNIINYEERHYPPTN